jgi:predicted hotdog family 3-hydroxylacyl-ACP dehydratase
MVLCMDVAEPCDWLATPDGPQRHRINISMAQVRGLLKAGLITTRRDRNAIYTTFVISAKGQAEVRTIKHRQSQVLLANVHELLQRYEQVHPISN